MKANDWLISATDQLTKAGISTARLDCMVLLEDQCNKDRAWLLAHSEYSLNATQLKKLDDYIKQRARHEPLAYIRGKTEFYGRDFMLSKDTLEPRPESETLIDLLKKLVKPYDKLTLADIGTGSGALAITAKLERSQLKVVATEISNLALLVAKQNAQRHDVNLSFYQGDLLKPLIKERLDIVIANLPYVPDSFTINPAAMQEPKIAIFGGLDGLDIYRQLFHQISSLIQKPRWVLTECLPPQHPELTRIARENGYKQSHQDDFIQLFTTELEHLPK